MPWFDVLTETKRIEQLVIAATGRHEPPLLAFVCAETHGGWSRFDAHAWRDTLPGCTVLPVPCVGWIPPKLIERVFAHGATGVVVLSCSDENGVCREGARWFDLRLAGEREPKFHRERAGSNCVLRLAFDATAPGETRAAVAKFAAGLRPNAGPDSRPRAALAGPALAGLLALVTVAGSLAPFRNSAPATPELVLSLEAWGDWIEAAPVSVAEIAARPIHMRNVAVTGHRERAPVLVQLTVDGATSEEIIRPLGLSRDGACLAIIRRPLAPGSHDVRVALTTAPGTPPKFTWTGRLQLVSRRTAVIAFAPATGFRTVP